MEVLKVLSLNCWLIPHISKDVPRRVRLIAEELARRDFDLVGLQEVWSNADFEIIKEAVKENLPYAHYFHSGVIGSGCAVLSKYPIVDVFFQPYTFNGYFYAYNHGDWFGGKGLGCAIVDHPLGKIHFFDTHIHADYSDNTYKSVRTLQMYQVSQIIRHMTRPTDLVVMTGDFNHEQHEIGVQTLIQLTELKDSYQCASVKPEPCFTLDRNTNPYSPKDEVQKRIDYVFHSKNIQCLNSSLDMQIDSKSGIHFSDHEGFTSSLLLPVNGTTKEEGREDVDGTITILKEVRSVMEEGQQGASVMQWNKLFAVFILFLTFACMPVFSLDSFHLVFPTISTLQGKAVFVVQIVSIVFCIVYGWVVLINNRTEINAFHNVIEEVNTRIEALTKESGIKKLE